MKLKGRVAIVTGASRGIGRAFALALAKEGASVVVTAKTTDRAPNPKLPGTIDAVAREIEESGGRALALKCDVRKVENVEAMVAKAFEHFGRIDILVNNAALPWWYPVTETQEKHFDRVMNANCKGPFFAARAVLPHMIKNKFGFIVNNSPPIEPRMAAGRVAYMIAKMGQTLIAHGLAEEVKEHNIAVCALWPVTLIESYATIGMSLGKRENWRRPDIMGDALVALVTRAPVEVTGKAWLDEDILREAGVTDFSKYACVAGAEPMKIPW